MGNQKKRNLTLPVSLETKSAGLGEGMVETDIESCYFFLFQHFIFRDNSFRFSRLQPIHKFYVTKRKKLRNKKNILSIVIFRAKNHCRHNVPAKIVKKSNQPLYQGFSSFFGWPQFSGNFMATHFRNTIINTNV